MISELHSNQLDRPLPPEEHAYTQKPTQGVFSAFLGWAHQRLRGRYGYAVPLALILAIGGGYAGFVLGPIKFKSTGQIVVAPIDPAVLKPTDEKGILPTNTMYDAFLQTQISFLTTQRVLEMAMAMPAWQNLGRPRDDEALKKFDKSLNVTRIKDTEAISVEFTDTDEKAAMIGAASVIAAYKRLYLEDDSHNVEKRIELLEQRKSALVNELAGVRQQIRKVAEQFSTDDLDTLFKSKLTDLENQQKDLKEVEVALAQRTGMAAGDDELTDEQIACEDLLMSTYLSQRVAIQRQADRLAERVGPGHRSLMEAQSDLAAINQAIEARGKAYRAYRGMSGQGARTAGLGIAGVAIPTEQLKTRLAGIKDVVQKGQAELMEIGKQKLELTKLKDDADDVKLRLDETRKRIEQLNIESALQARINVTSEGDRPLKPYRDYRLLLTPAGLLGGFGLGMGFFVLLGSMDRRLRYIDDARKSFPANPILGILPTLPEDLADPEQAAVAADCVNRIRTLLQISSGNTGQQVFAITSPASGTGKTSLTLALGISFAAVGSRTLLIDCDLVGGGLSGRIRGIARRKLGWLLERKGLVSRQRLDEALRLSKAANRKLGEVLVEEGYLRQEELKQALAEQEKAPMGLLEAMDGEELVDCIADTGTANLKILPIGVADVADAGSISPVALRRVVEAAREQFDTILIDTGPIPGSLEAAAAVAVCDGVIMTVSRGEQRPHAEQAMRYLEMVGARLAGIVFNRARRDEMSRLASYVASSSIHRSSALAKRSRAEAGAERSSRFGPVAGAMATFAPAARNGHGGRLADAGTRQHE